MNEPNVKRKLSVLNVKRNKKGLNVKGKKKELMSLKGLDLRKKSKFSVYAQSMILRLQK